MGFLTSVDRRGADAGVAHALQVTPDNFARAESDMYFAHSVKDAGGIGTLHHFREPVPVEKQPVVRANRDRNGTAARQQPCPS